MQIRGYVASDLDELFKIDQECFPPGISYSLDELARFINDPDSVTWVAEVNHQKAGFIVADRRPHRVGHIITIDVVESGRRAGVGTALMYVVEEWARRQGLKLMYLETAEDNQPAQAFYKARGYEKVEEIGNYYSSGRTAWVMVKWLEKPKAAGRKSKLSFLTSQL